MIVTPLIGSIILFWMIDSRGIVGNFLQIMFEDPNLSLKASTSLTWVTLIVYGVWHAIPFSFIVFYMKKHFFFLSRDLIKRRFFLQFLVGVG